MWIDNGGNVGIGTTSPIVKLQVVGPMRFGTSGTRGLLDDSSTPGAGSIQLTADDLTTSGILFRTRNAVGTGDRMVIDNNGNVGIGETNPGADLDIKSKTAGANALSDARSTAAMWVDGIAGGSSWGLAVGQVAGLFDSYLQAMDKAQQSAAALLLNPYGGNVGIGTASPSSLLHVVGQITSSGDDDTNGITASGNAHINVKATGASGAVRFWANGAEQMRVQPSGNVGIGTTGPVEKLTIKASDPAQDLIRFEDDTGASYLSMGVSRTGGYGFIHTTSGEEAAPLIALKTGKVGIGTNNPQQILAIKEQGNSPAAIQFLDTDNARHGDIGWARANNDLVSGSTNLDLVINNRWGTPNGASLLFGIGDIERMRILGNGNVGIGTSSPGARLEVKDNNLGTGTVALIRQDDDNTYGLVVNNAAWSGTVTNGLRQYVKLTGTYAAIDHFESGGAALSLNPSGGNVGIGKTSPASKLHIKQSSNTKTGGIILEGSSGGQCWMYTTGSANCGTDTQLVSGGSGYRLCVGCD
jgi:hypothetical protein